MINKYGLGMEEVSGATPVVARYASRVARLGLTVGVLVSDKTRGNRLRVAFLSLIHI